MNPAYRPTHHPTAKMMNFLGWSGLEQHQSLVQTSIEVRAKAVSSYR
jgi:hypothetical protein